MRPLVLGAAGFLGVNLVDALRAAGVEPLCGRRKRTNVLPLRSRRVSLVPADLDAPDELVAAMRDTDVVFHLAGHYPRHSLDREGALATGLRQLDHVLDAAATAGVRRVVYVSSTATVAPAATGLSTEAHTYASAPGFGVYHDLKWHMEARARAEDRVDVVIACPSACLGPWDLRIGTSALLVGLARGLDPAHPDGWVGLVDVADVATALVHAARHPDPPRRFLVSGGNHRLHDLLVALADRYRVSAPSKPLTDEQAIALANAEEARAAQEGGRAWLSREIVDLVVHGVPLSAELAERTFDLAWTPLTHTLDRFDAWARRMRFIPEAP